jgi:hypothetical protein
VERLPRSVPRNIRHSRTLADHRIAWRPSRSSHSDPTLITTDLRPAHSTRASAAIISQPSYLAS